VTWDGTDNQMQIDGAPVELSLFAGGGAAELAVELFDHDEKDVRTFYARELSKVYPEYHAELASEPQFVCWPRDRWTKAGYSCPAPGEVTVLSSGLPSMTACISPENIVAFPSSATWKGRYNRAPMPRQRSSGARWLA